MTEMTFRGSAGTEPGPGRGEATHRLAFLPGGPDQAQVMRFILSGAPAGGAWRPGRVEDAGPEIIVCLVTASDTDGTEGSDWLFAAVADFERRVRATLGLVDTGTHGPDDQPYLAELSSRGWIYLADTGPPGNDVQTPTVTETGRLVLAG